MTKFIRLSSKIINTSFITNIDFASNQYYINMFIHSSSLYGMLFAGSGFFAGGNFNHRISICAKSNPDDYKIIDDWIKTIK